MRLRIRNRSQARATKIRSAVWAVCLSCGNRHWSAPPRRARRRSSPGEVDAPAPITAPPAHDGSGIRFSSISLLISGSALPQHAQWIDDEAKYRDHHHHHDTDQTANHPKTGTGTEISPGDIWS